MVVILDVNNLNNKISDIVICKDNYFYHQTLMTNKLYYKKWDIFGYHSVLSCLLCLLLTFELNFKQLDQTLC